MIELFDKTMYHGTTKYIERFDLSFCGTGTKMPLGHLGLYFTECPELASKFCKNKWNSNRSKYRKNSVVYPVKIMPRKPVYWSALQFIQYSGHQPEALKSIREQLLLEGHDCIVVKASNDHCQDELYVPQIIVLDDSIINFSLAA